MNGSRTKFNEASINNNLRQKGNSIMNSKKISIKDIIAKHFQYGMVMDGVLYPDEHTNMVYTIDTKFLTIFFDFKLTNTEEFTKQKISLDWPSPCYGSKKVYFTCPICGRRAMTLYNSVAAYVCRECDKAANKGHPDDWQEHSHLLALL